MAYLLFSHYYYHYYYCHRFSVEPKLDESSYIHVSRFPFVSFAEFNVICTSVHFFLSMTTQTLSPRQNVCDISVSHCTFHMKNRIVVHDYTWLNTHTCTCICDTARDMFIALFWMGSSKRDAFSILPVTGWINIRSNLKNTRCLSFKHFAYHRFLIRFALHKITVRTFKLHYKQCDIFFSLKLSVRIWKKRL